MAKTKKAAPKKTATKAAPKKTTVKHEQTGNLPTEVNDEFSGLTEEQKVANVVNNKSAT